MLSVRPIKRHRSTTSESGMAYVMILFIMVISVSLGLSFLLRVGTETEAAMSRASGMQTKYLAESAANHAKWRLLNEPAFPADESTYYMHSFAGGRYGYKVRRHTNTTFATIASIGVLGDDLVQQSYVMYVIPDTIPGLLGWWKLDETSGTNAEDSSGAGNDGTLTSMAGDEWSSGIADGALCFDGSNDYVDIGSVSGTVQSIAFWMKPNTIGGSGDTGFHSPSSEGDDYDQWSNPNRAYSSDNSRTNESSNGQQQDWYDFTFGVPVSASILGIEVQIEGRAQDWWDPTGVDLEISWDGGATYTTSGYGYTTSDESDVVRTFGGASDEWGRTWSNSELSDTNFRIRLDKQGGGFGRRHEVDHIQVKVYHSIVSSPSKVIDLNGSAHIDIDAGDVTPIGFPGTTTVYVDTLASSTVTTAWHHIVITDTTGISATDLLLGRLSSDFFDGCLDDVRLYDHVLSQTEIDELTLSAGLVAHWMLDDGSGGTASDSTGNGHDGTLTNMDPATDWVAGHINGALDLDGSNDRVTVPHDPALSLTSNFTIAAWVNSQGLNGWDIIIGKGNSGTTWNYYFATNGDQIALGFYDGGWAEFQGGPNLSTGVWYHLAVTFEPDNDLIRFFVDGAEVYSVTTNQNPLANSEDVWLGASPWGAGEQWNGVLDDVRVYNRLLNDSEIATLAGM